MVQLSRDIAQQVVNRIATGLGRPVSVTDVGGHVLVNTTQVAIGTYLPCAAESIATGQLCRERGGQDAVLCVPLLYDSTTLGAIVLHQVASNERDYQDIALVSQTLAELIIYQSMAIEQFSQQRWAHDKFVYDLLHSQLHSSPEMMRHEASLFGIDLHVPRIAALVDIAPFMTDVFGSLQHASSVTRGLQAEQAHERILEQATVTTRSNDADVFSFVDDHQLIVLAVVDPTALEARHRQLKDCLQHLLDVLAQSFGVTVSAGIGCYHPGWQALSESFNDAQFAFETGVALCGKGQVYCVADLGLAGMLWSDDRATIAALAQRILQPLDGEDELWNTLEAYFQADLSPSQTAHVLHIHRHTLAYRLDRITHLTGLNPRRFHAATQLQAALILHKLSSATT